MAIHYITRLQLSKDLLQKVKQYNGRLIDMNWSVFVDLVRDARDRYDKTYLGVLLSMFINPGVVFDGEEFNEWEDRIFFSFFNRPNMAFVEYINIKMVDGTEVVDIGWYKKYNSEIENETWFWKWIYEECYTVRGVELFYDEKYKVETEEYVNDFGRVFLKLEIKGEAEGYVSDWQIYKILSAVLKDNNCNLKESVLDELAESLKGYIEYSLLNLSNVMVESALCSFNKDYADIIEKEQERKRIEEEEKRRAELELNRKVNNIVTKYRKFLKELGLYVYQEPAFSFIKLLDDSGINLKSFEDAINLISGNTGLSNRAVEYYGDSQSVIYDIIAVDVTSGMDEDNYMKAACVSNYIFVLMEKDTEQKFLSACKN